MGGRVSKYGSEIGFSRKEKMNDGKESSKWWGRFCRAQEEKMKNCLLNSSRFASCLIPTYLFP